MKGATALYVCCRTFLIIFFTNQTKPIFLVLVYLDFWKPSIFQFFLNLLGSINCHAVDYICPFFVLCIFPIGFIAYQESSSIFKHTIYLLKSNLNWTNRSWRVNLRLTRTEAPTATKSQTFWTTFNRFFRRSGSTAGTATPKTCPDIILKIPFPLPTR